MISAVLLRKSFNTIASSVNVKMFSTAALIYFIGRILTIVGVGLLLIFLAVILHLVVSSSIPESPPQATPTSK